MSEQERTVLFVDDEVEILNSIKRQLRKSEFSIICTDSSAEALRILKENNIQVIVSDENMPEMKGVDLLKEVKEHHPDIIRIILSGFADSETLIRSINQGEIYRFISKPWGKEELTEVIRDGFARFYNMQSQKIYMKRMIDENIALINKQKETLSRIEINRDVLNMIPQPIIAVSEDYRAAIINHKAKNFFNKKLTEGVYLKDIFSAKTTGQIISGLSLPDGQATFEIEAGEETVRIFTKSIDPGTGFRGLLFFDNHC